MIEVLIIIVLLVVFFFNWKILSPETYKIKTTSDELIYSPDKSKPFTGKMQDTLNNKLIVEFEVVDGFKQGEYILLTMDGNYAVQGYMNKNKNSGTWKYFYDNGKLECTGEFNNDVATGTWKWYYDTGTLKSSGTFINGKPDGRWFKYDQYGILMMIVNYRNGEVVNAIQIDLLAGV